MKNTQNFKGRTVEFLYLLPRKNQKIIFRFMIDHAYLNRLRENIRNKNNSITSKRIKWIQRNRYYYRKLLKHLKFIIPEDSKVLHIRCSIGYILNELNPREGVGIDNTDKQIEEAKRRYPHLTFYDQSVENIQLDKKFDYILITSLGDIVDIKAVLDTIKKLCLPHTRIIFINYNYLWNPLVKLAESLGLRLPQNLHNWITEHDLSNFLTLSDYDTVYKRKAIMLPYNIPGISYIFNRFLARIPIIRHLSFINIRIARLYFPADQDFSVSVVIPCKNEAGNIEDATRRIPQLGSHTEIIFCDDKSTDGTPDKVKEMMQKYPDKDIKLFDGPGISKSENVWVGFDGASGDILMILDADLTVIPEELPYFYEAIATRKGEFINGSRLVYPMHDNAMKFLNIIGNKFFSLFFSYILETQIKDTLCGTKVLWKRDYEKIKQIRNKWGIHDRWGDYELIFGAAKYHLKHLDLPIHYYERTYGESKMRNLLKNGAVMLRMSFAALFKIKFHY